MVIQLLNSSSLLIVLHFLSIHMHTCLHTDTQSTDSLSTGQAVGITVVVTFIVSVLIGLAVGVGVTYLIMRDKIHKTVDVPTEAPPQQQQPTPGPIYEEVAPEKDGPVGQ